MPLAPDDAVAATPDKEPADDLRAMISQEYDRASEPDAQAGVADPGPGDAQAPGAEAKPATGDRPRNPDGTFAKVDAKPEGAADKPATTAPDGDPAKVPNQQDKTKAPVEATSISPDGPPVSWSADAKEAWSSAPAALKAAVLKRENEMAAGGRQWSEQKRYYEETLTPLAERARANGISVNDAINRVIQIDAGMQRDPVGTLMRLASVYGVNLGSLGGQTETATSGQQSAPSGSVSPSIDLSPLERRLAGLESFFEQQTQQQAQAVQTDVQAFAEANKYFNDVADDVMALIPHVRASMPGRSHGEILAEAYARAVRANPATFNAWLADRDAELETKRTAERNGAAQRALLAGSSATGAPNGAAHQQQSELSLRDEIRRAMST